MKVGELKKALENINDDVPVVVWNRNDGVSEVDEAEMILGFQYQDSSEYEPVFSGDSGTDKLVDLLLLGY